MSDVLSHRLALDQRRDAEAVVPVAAAEEQLPVVGDHKQPPCHLHAGGKGSRQETLGSRRRQTNKYDKAVFFLTCRLVHFLHGSYLVLDTVGSLMKVK